MKLLGYSFSIVVECNRKGISLSIAPKVKFNCVYIYGLISDGSPSLSLSLALVLALLSGK